MGLGTDKDVEKMAKVALRAGWKVTVTRGNHIKWVSPDGEMYISSLSFGDKRRIKQLRKFLTTRGVEL